MPILVSGPQKLEIPLGERRSSSTNILDVLVLPHLLHDGEDTDIGIEFLHNTLGIRAISDIGEILIVNIDIDFKEMFILIAEAIAQSWHLVLLPSLKLKRSNTLWKCYFDHIIFDGFGA